MNKIYSREKIKMKNQSNQQNQYNNNRSNRNNQIQKIKIYKIINKLCLNKINSKPNQFHKYLRKRIKKIKIMGKIINNKLIKLK